MTAGRQLLLFAAPADDAPDWLRLDGERVVARGDGVPPAPADDAPERIVLAVPGDAVAIHWVEMPELSPAQGRAAARLLVAELAAAPVETLHVALGAVGADGFAPVALVETGRIAGWIADAEAAGLDPHAVLPEPLLLPLGEGEAQWTRGALTNVRGPQVAHGVEPELAAALAEPGAAMRVLDPAGLEQGLAERLADPVLDLRQGPFARRRRWRIDWAHARRLAVLAGLILLATLGVQIVLLSRYAAAADRAEAEMAAIAAEAGAGGSADPRAALAARLAQVGGGAGFDAAAGALFAALRDTGSVELTALGYTPEAGLTATVRAPGAAEIGAVTARLQAAGLAVAQAPGPGDGGQASVQLTVRAR